MTTFLQLHLLTSYPPACLNRDDLNRPKTAMMGGVQRLRISSQSLKRAWRESDVFKFALDGHVGTQTKRKGIEVFNTLKERNIADSDAMEWAKVIAGQFGKLEAHDANNPLKELKIKQVAHFSPEEEETIRQLADKLASEKRPPIPDELELLRKNHRAADIALFGRMLAEKPKFNTEAACQVAHAITVHRVAVEDDFFTAVDDLNKREEDAGSAHMDEQGFAAGLFYLYLCADCTNLSEQLGNELAKKTISALTEAAATVAPAGKQNSFGSRAWASYVLAEMGTRQPRSLSVAFLEPVKGERMLPRAIEKLEETRKNMDGVYYGWSEKETAKNDKPEKIREANSLPCYCLDADNGNGNLQELLTFASHFGGA